MSEALAFVEKYADDIFEFAFYYKYSFNYVHTENSEVTVTVGGNSSAIYRADMTDRMPLCKIIAEAGGEYARATDGDKWLDLEGDDVYALAYARLKARTLTTT